MKCVSTVTCFINHKGKELGLIQLGRGFHQGDPISPYLFILCAEGLLCFLNDMEVKCLIHMCKIARGAPTLSHFFFADDSYLFFRADIQECRISNIACRFKPRDNR